MQKKSMKKIAVLPGDGIGPEVTEQAVKVLDAIADRYDHHFEYCFADVGADAIDKTGSPLPEFTLEACLNADAILFGAIGHPRYDNDPKAKVRPEQGLLRLRRELALFANIRPVKVYPRLLHLSPLRPERVEGVDFVIYRELTGGIYFGEKGRQGDEAYDRCTYSRQEIERIARPAFAKAARRRGKLTLVDKANVLETSRLWRETVMALSVEYPQVSVDFMYVDNAAMQLIQHPQQFDLILTSNMFGDILSDEASVIVGSMGLLPSASIGSANGLFEPIHGSYPQAAGKDIANPMAAMLSAAMMLDWFDLTEEARTVREAVRLVLDKGLGTPELNPRISCSCSQIGDMVSHLVLEPEERFDLKEEQIKATVSTII